jgi:hypothetical protein
MKTLLSQCCICGDYKNNEGKYETFLPTCPHIPITSGYCDSCRRLMKKHRLLRLLRKILLQEDVISFYRNNGH